MLINLLSQQPQTSAAVAPASIAGQSGFAGILQTASNNVPLKVKGIGETAPFASDVAASFTSSVAVAGEGVTGVELAADSGADEVMATLNGEGTTFDVAEPHVQPLDGTLIDAAGASVLPFGSVATTMTVPVLSGPPVEGGPLLSGAQPINVNMISHPAPQAAAVAVGTAEPRQPKTTPPSGIAQISNGTPVATPVGDLQAPSIVRTTGDDIAQPIGKHALPPSDHQAVAHTSIGKQAVAMTTATTASAAQPTVVGPTFAVPGTASPQQAAALPTSIGDVAQTVVPHSLADLSATRQTEPMVAASSPRLASTVPPAAPHPVQQPPGLPGQDVEFSSAPIGQLSNDPGVGKQTIPSAQVQVATQSAAPVSSSETGPTPTPATLDQGAQKTVTVAAQIAASGPTSSAIGQAPVEARKNGTPLKAESVQSVATSNSETAEPLARPTAAPTFLTDPVKPGLINQHIGSTPARTALLPDTPRIDPPPLAGQQPPVAAAAKLAEEFTPKAPVKPFAEALLQQVKAIDVSEGRTTVNLHPRGLGNIEVEVLGEKDSPSKVVVRVENPAVLHALREERHILAQVIGVADSSVFEFHEHGAQDHQNDQSGSGSGSNDLFTDATTGEAAQHHVDVIDQDQLDIVT